MLLKSLSQILGRNRVSIHCRFKHRYEMIAISPSLLGCFSLLVIT